VGSGYFFEEVSKHIVNFYLGYSHLITVETDKNIFINVTGRKQRILIIQSHDLLSLRNLGFFIKNLHNPDVYRGKGIRYLNENLTLKKGKKKFV
jgi:large subunit ribosomal protein L6